MVFDDIDPVGWQMLAAHGFDKESMKQEHGLDEADLEQKIILQNTYINLLDVLDFKEVADEMKSMEKGNNFQIGININNANTTSYFKEVEMHDKLGTYLTATNNIPILNITNPKHYHPREAASELVMIHDEAVETIRQHNPLNLKPIVHNMYLRQNSDNDKKLDFMLLSLVAGDEYKSSEDIINEANKKYVHQHMPTLKMLQGNDQETESDLVLSIGQYNKRKHGTQPRIRTDGIYQDPLMDHKKRLEKQTNIPLFPFRAEGAKNTRQINELYRELFSILSSYKK
ncbi:MAG: hypothetical protein ACLFSN_03155 [Candidatus Woesearchaeota archaeon]